MTTFELIEKAESISSKLMMATGDEAINAILESEDEWMGDAIGKLEAHRHVRMALLAKCEHLTSESDRLALYADRIKRNIESIDQRVLALVQTYEVTTGKDRAQLNDGSWVRSRVQESMSVEVTNEEALDPFYTTTTTKPDKKLIKEDIMNGQAVNGARLTSKLSTTLRWSK